MGDRHRGPDQIADLQAVSRELDEAGPPTRPTGGSSATSTAIPEEPKRIDASHITDIGTAIRVDVLRERLRVTGVEVWARERVVTALSGSADDPDAKPSGDIDPDADTDPSGTTLPPGTGSTTSWAVGCGSPTGGNAPG